MIAPLGLTCRIVEVLDRSGITYCHWKGNYSLDRVMSGEKDFELLVDRRSLNQTIAILLTLGLKRAVVNGEERTPGVSHFYGLDPQAGRLVHIHLYGNFLTGESFIKSHWLPFDNMLLDNAETLRGVRVPTRAAELISHTLRVFIKYGSLLDLIYLLKEAKDNEAEFRWLLADNDIAETLRILKGHIPLIDESLFLQCVDSFRTPTSVLKRLVVAQRIRRSLRGYERNSGFTRELRYVQLLLRHGWRQLFGIRNNKMLHTGGIVIAFVGPEATGKSTLVAECERWLGEAFGVQTLHAGKPPSSWLTAPVNSVLPLMRRLVPRLRTSRLEGHVSATESGVRPSRFEGLPWLMYSLRAAMLAWDRRRLLLGARRSAAHGVIVICDRYPSDTIGTMDSPRLQERVDQKGILPAICNWLARLEERLYQQIPAPDIALRLRVSIEAAKVRNRERIKAGKESEAYVESRHRMASAWRRCGTRYVTDIDTEMPLSETVIQVKQAIWESL